MNTIPKPTTKQKLSSSFNSPELIHRITQQEKARVYRQILSRIQANMGLPSRVMSKIIHFKLLDNFSEVVSSTIARPTALLTGSLASLVFLTSIYTIGKVYGYQLSGFEVIGSYLIGWLFGLVIDYIKFLFVSQRTSSRP
ncbi:MAG: hypothetical protein WAW60_01885 [Candidatus Saccharimonadales bacterium]